jgi:hypothetical protein
MADEKQYPPDGGLFTVGRPYDDAEAGEKVAAWVAAQLDDDGEGGDAQ